jgi:hypothetical protein
LTYGGFVNREHLTSQEIDVLLDDDPSVDDSVLRAHLSACEECRKSYQNARHPVALLEHLPYRSPSPDFAARVIARVHVFEPVHVTVLDALRRYTPASGRLRVALASTVGAMGLMLTSLLVWAATRLDAIIFLAGLGLARARLWGSDLVEQLLVDVAGQQTVDILGLQGARGVWYAMALVLASVFVSAMGLRTLAAAARRARS